MLTGMFSRKFHNSYSKERAKAKVHFEGVAEHALYVYSKIYAISNHSEKRFCDASCMFKAYRLVN